MDVNERGNAAVPRRRSVGSVWDGTRSYVVWYQPGTYRSYLYALASTGSVSAVSTDEIFKIMKPQPLAVTIHHDKLTRMAHHFHINAFAE